MFLKLVILICLTTNFHFARSACSDSDWECDNAECISEYLRCDGVVNCHDRSDEIAENCIQFRETCPQYAFRCQYGACIPARFHCDGVQNCADNSDELKCLKKCTEDEMRCVTSKECISSSNVCDGHVHCEDGSDETLELCIDYSCTSGGFQCGYGACVSGNARCNGTTECADGSDESWALCDTPRKKTQTPTSALTEYNGCLLPNIPETQELIFKRHPQNETTSAGSLVSDFETIHMECKNRYYLDGQSSLLCQNGRWSQDFPLCLKFCDSKLLDGISIRTVCIYNHRFVTCSKRIRPGTEILINCAIGFTRTPNNPQFLKCLRDGTFDKNPEHCQSSCGRVVPYSVPLSKNGIPIKSSSAPWHVAIYQNNSVVYDYICSGSIVSPRIILTAAHCFWDEANLILTNNTKYQIIAGRDTSNYTTVQSEYSQIIEIEEIHTPIDYGGKRKRQRSDIAFVKLKSPLVYSETIAPICIPKELSTALKYVVSNQIGFMAGFGINNHLERLKMVTLAYHDCKDRSPADATVADDKFCIYSSEGGSVCRGDSGGGFYTESRYPDEIDIIYNLLGIISNTPTTKHDCTRSGDEAYVAITNIHYIAMEFKEKLQKAIKDDEELF